MKLSNRHTYDTWGMFRENFFVVSTGADYKRLQNYKIAKIFVRGGGEDGDGMG